MWIVSFALRRPLSVSVMALLMLVLGALAFTRMNADIFPAIDMPVVIVVWGYPGLSAIDMERRVVIISERAMSTTVNDIEHMESESIAGAGIVRVYFHPGTTTAAGIAQIGAMSQALLSNFPPGIVAPNVVDYNAANVPVAQLNVFSDTLSEQQIFDYGLNFIRVRLFSIEGLSAPSPFGGRTRSIMVNLNPTQLYANGLSALDVSTALANTNTIIPAGSVKIGNREYRVELNGSPDQVAKFNALPIKLVNGTPIFLGDVAPVTDTHQVQANVVRVDGHRATYIPIFKHAAASTLSVIDNVKNIIPLILETAPKGLKIKLAFDQSVFVRGALWGVVREAIIAAGLVALMVLIFLGSARSMLIVILSIPLSILTAIIFLQLSGQTINIMTLGGLALAVGMLVDDATVAIENIHRHHAMHKPLLVAILDGSAADRDAGVYWHAGDLHRVLSGGAAVRGGAVFIHAAGAGGGLLDADVVPAFAHPGAGDGALPDAGDARRFDRHGVMVALCRRLRSRVRSLSGRLSRSARRVHRAARIRPYLRGDSDRIVADSRSGGG